MSFTSNSGSPKNFSAPCDSSSIIWRSNTPTEAVDIPPYCASFGLAVVRAQELEYGPQVGKVEKQELVVVAVLEDHREYAGLGLVERKHLTEKHRPERAHGGPKLHAGIRP